MLLIVTCNFHHVKDSGLPIWDHSQLIYDSHSYFEDFLPDKFPRKNVAKIDISDHFVANLKSPLRPRKKRSHEHHS